MGTGPEQIASLLGVGWGGDTWEGLVEEGMLKLKT